MATTAAPRARNLRTAILLTALVLALLLPGAFTAPLVDRDEPRFATATAEMIERGAWIVPTFNGLERFDKPILTYWLMRAGYALLGSGEAGARLHSVLATIAVVLLVAFAGARWVGARAALTAAVGFATCLQVFIHGQLAVADMPMIAAVTAVQFAIAELLLRPERETASPAWWWTLYLALGIGFLAKGPIAFAVPALSLVLMRWVFWRAPLPWARLRAGRGLAVTLAVVATWGVPALIATHGQFLAVGIGEHVVRRGVEPFNARHYSPLFYVFSAPLSLFPWIAGAGYAWRGFRCIAPAGVARAGLNADGPWWLSWLAAPYVIFTPYATQLPHYVLPAFPAFFLLLARGLDDARQDRVVRVLATLLFAIAAALVVAAAALPLALRTPTEALALRNAFVSALLVFGGLAAGAAAWLRGESTTRDGLHYALRLAVPGWVVAAVGGALLGVSLDAMSPSVQLSELLRDMPVNTRWIGSGFAEPSLVFYTRRHWEWLDDTDAIAAAARGYGPVVVVTVERETDPLKLLTGKPDWHQDGRAADVAAITSGAGDAHWQRHAIAGFNTGRSRWQELAVWVRLP